MVNIPVCVFPVVQELVKRQVPPLPHVLVQHLTSEGSLGQYPLWVVPPADVQELELKQTPGVLPAVQASLIAA